MQLFDLDLWQEIVDTLRRHKLRTALTAFGVFWGIFMLVTLMGAGQGLKNGAESNFGGSLNVIYFWKGGATTIPYKGLDTGRDILLRHSDVEYLRSKLSNIKYLSPYLGFDNEYATYKNRGDSYTISGNPHFISDIYGFELEQGRFLNELDSNNYRKVAIIGFKVKNTLFPYGENPIGKSIKVRGMQFTVVGVFSPSAKSDWAQRDASKIFIPYTTIKSISNVGDRIYSLAIVFEDEIDANVMEQKIKNLLLKRNLVHPDDQGVLGSFNKQKEYNKIHALFSGIMTFSWIVAIGTIMAGAIGVGNIMLISVKERTKEIGLRKAIGATPASIITMIVQESLAITFFSGYIGLVVGVLMIEGLASILAAQGGNNQMFANPEIDFFTAISAIVVLLLAGLVAALLPAAKAAKVDPAIALQDQ